MYNKIELNGNWKLAGCPEGKGALVDGNKVEGYDVGPVDASVPTEVYPALHFAGVIPDPMDPANADDIKWVEDKEWWYSVTFDLPQGFNKKKSLLTFNGLDTRVSIWMNGQEIGHAENKNIPHTFDVTALLQDGGPNSIAVRFDPAAVSGQHSRLNATGIWRGVQLVSYDQLAISDVYVQPIRHGNDADAWIYLTVDNFTGEDIEAQFVLIVARGEAREKTEFTEIIPASGDVIEAVIRIEDPELWYPNGAGEQPMYHALIGLSADGEIQDVHERYFGVRSVELAESTININGINISPKISDWHPVEVFPSRLSKETYEKLLTPLKEQGINILRVRGGGNYEDPAFYGLCDELGIMILQDFMFSLPAPFTGDSFYNNALTEIRYAVQSLRNHPSVIIWCGKGENGSAEDNRLFEETIPAVLEELDGTRPYRSKCPV